MNKGFSFCPCSAREESQFSGMETERRSQQFFDLRCFYGLGFGFCGFGTLNTIEQVLNF
jgi:hypothetical protein